MIRGSVKLRKIDKELSVDPSSTQINSKSSNVWFKIELTESIKNLEALYTGITMDTFVMFSTYFTLHLTTVSDKNGQGFSLTTSNSYPTFKLAIHGIISKKSVTLW